MAVFLTGCLRDLRNKADLSFRLRGASMLWMILGLALLNGYFTVKSPYLGGAFYGF